MGTSFLEKVIPELMDRFVIDYSMDTTCMEYYLHTRDRKMLISKSMIISHSLCSNSVYVSKFYPEIYRELNCKYLSAACFYMIIHHAADHFHLNDGCLVNLESETAVFERFYSRLREFDFRIKYHRPTDRVSAEGRYMRLPFDITAIRHCRSVGEPGASAPLPGSIQR